MKKKGIAVMVNGLPGKMATKVCEHIMGANKFFYPFRLIGYSLTGPEVNKKKVSVNGFKINLFRPVERDELHKTLTWYKNRFTLIAVDFSLPSAVNLNAEFYCANKIPFVMGTTGGDRTHLMETVKQSGNCAVIASNMAKQIVALQAMMKFSAENFPGAFKGYSLEIVESHQKGKKDTSQTAKDMVKYFNQLGIPFSEEQIFMVREPEQQKAMGIPEDALKGHGWHTYTLRSPDGSVSFQFTHNVNGRDVYALGVLEAISFLAENIGSGVVYSMMDVLEG